MTRALVLLPHLALICLAACSKPDRSEHYTLYRNSAADETLRVHWATFDADESGAYNRTNCLLAADLLNENLHRLNGLEATAVRFWCEPGKFRLRSG